MIEGIMHSQDDGHVVQYGGQWKIRLQSQNCRQIIKLEFIMKI